jgi:hypothetical protein
MYQPIENGTVKNIQGLDCNIPPVGYVVNVITNQLEYVGVYSRSEDPLEQYWERIAYPSWYKDVIKKEDEYLKRKKEDDPPFYDERYEEYKRQEWSRRLNGFWVMIKGEAVYLTGFYYMLLQWFSIDVGYAKFIFPHLHKTYFLQYCIEDPLCMGMIDVTKRRFLKTFMGGLFILEYVTRTKMVNGTLQSKTGNDAKAVFGKAIVYPFRKFPRFFRPEYDMSLGVNPKSEIRFQQTNIRGKKAEDSIDKDELGSMVAWGSADPIHFDGWKIHRYFSDEWGKCFAKGTKIRMYDGSVKNVENIGEGELVMGDDSTARITYGITKGKEEMFRIVPKKGVSWECNISHILSLKWCLNRDNKRRGWKAKGVVNISVRDFLCLKPSEQRHLMLYKKPVEYTEQAHQLDPYFLGLWLGDGSKYNPEITTADIEIVEYLKELAKIEGLEFSNPEHIQYRLYCKRSNKLQGTVNGIEYSFDSGRLASDHFGYKGDFTKTNIFRDNDWKVDNNKKNRLLSAMQFYSLVENKHIPDEFLIDSRKNRLELLAGLVDSDGYISLGPTGKPKSIEITQKIKHLSYQISELATSLGFYSSVNPKVATMRRNDKSIYKCDVYKVMIYGDLWEIPMKVKRKQVPKIDFHVNRRTPAHCGFSISSVGEGEYYGFAVDGNHLFLLEDGTVVHNTVEANIFDRHEVIRYCLLDEEGNIIGKALYSTTVEKNDSDKDGVQKAAKDLWHASNQNSRQPNGMTQSGLYRFFQTSDEGRNFDKYGYPDVEQTIKDILLDREGVKDNQRSLFARIRKEPRTIDEAFSVDADTCIFNSFNIAKRRKQLELNPVHKRGIWFFRDEDTQRVKWRDITTKEKSFHWEVTPDFPLSEEGANRWVRDINSSLRKPGNTEFGAIGIDGYSNTQGGQKWGSRASGWAGTRAGNGRKKKMIGNIYGRPNEKETLHDQVLLCAEWLGVQAYYEHNSDDYYPFFKQRGRLLYLGLYPIILIDPVKLESTERHRGVPTTPYSLTKQADLGVSYFENNFEDIDFEILFDDAEVFDPNDRNKSDVTVSFLITNAVLSEPIQKPVPRKIPLVRRYDGNGQLIEN